MQSVTATGPGRDRCGDERDSVRMRHGHARRDGRAGRAREAVPGRWPPSTTSTSRSRPASSSRCSARRAAARPRRCGSSPGSNSRPTGQILLDGVDMAGTAARTSGPSTPSSRATRCSRTSSVEDNVAYGLRWRSGVDQGRTATPGRATRSSSCSCSGSRPASPRSCPEASNSASRSPRALILEPQVLLLDEPLGALDAKLRKALQVELTTVHREVGITFVYVTHDQEEALDHVGPARGHGLRQGRAVREPARRLRGTGERVRRRLPRCGEPARRRSATARRPAVVVTCGLAKRRCGSRPATSTCAARPRS